MNQEFPLNFYNQLRRAQAFEVDLQGTQEVQPCTTLVAAPTATDHTRYPDYPTNIGYRLGADRVSTLVPDPVPEQWRVCSPHLYQRFSHTDLPPLLSRIEPEFDRYFDSTAARVPMWHNSATGQPVLNAKGKRLRCFSFLPRYVARDISGALLEFWFRLDYRLEPADIMDRMDYEMVGKVTANALNMRRKRFRDRTHIIAWLDSRSLPTKGELHAVDKLTALQICLNTTMEIELIQSANGSFELRFLKPVYDDVECSQVTGYINAELDAAHFIRSSISDIPSVRMMATVRLRHRLQELAWRLGVGKFDNAGSSCNNWALLQNADAPSWWSGNSHGRNIHELDNLSHHFWLRTQFSELHSFVNKRAVARRKPQVRRKRAGTEQNVTTIELDSDSETNGDC